MPVKSLVATAYHCLSLIMMVFIMLCFSGTERQHVANDYAKRLAVGVAACQVL